VKFGKKISKIYQATHKHAPGAFGHKANDIVEWRGVLDGQDFVPHAIICRLTGSVDVDDDRVPNPLSPRRNRAERTEAKRRLPKMNLLGWSRQPHGERSPARQGSPQGEAGGPRQPHGVR